MPSTHSIGYVQINGHKYKDYHPLVNFTLNLLRDVLGALILGFAVLMPILLAGFLNS